MNCQYCHKEIVKPRKNKRFCSTTCRVEHFKQLKFAKQKVKYVTTVPLLEQKGEDGYLFNVSQAKETLEKLGYADWEHLMIVVDEAKNVAKVGIYPAPTLPAKPEMPQKRIGRPKKRSKLLDRVKRLREKR